MRTTNSTRRSKSKCPVSIEREETTLPPRAMVFGMGLSLEDVALDGTTLYLRLDRLERNRREEKALDACLSGACRSSGATLKLRLDSFAWHRREARDSMRNSLWSLLTIAVRPHAIELIHSMHTAERQGTQSVSLWLKPSSVAISAALTHQNQYLTSEIPSCQSPHFIEPSMLMWWYQRLQCIAMAFAPER